MEQSVANSPSPQLAAIYCRVSSERQEKERTIESQIAELEGIARKTGDAVVERYLDDGYSGELLERPALDKLRTDAKKKLFSKVYILSPDRLARKHHYAAIVLEDLARHGVQIVFSDRPLGESVEDRLLFNIQSVFADYEKAKILDRLRRGKLFKIRQGNVVGNVAPYGYQYRKDLDERRSWYEVDEHEAEIVRFIFSYYTSGGCSGMGGLRRELYRRNIKNRHGSTNWSQSTVARILSNETYIGTTYWGKYRSVENGTGDGYRRLKNNSRVRRAKEEWMAIKVPAIIDDSLFAAATALRARNKQLSSAQVKYDYLLRALIRCRECGSLMYSKSAHGTRYYVCSLKRNAFPATDVQCANAFHFRARELDGEVWNEFCRIVLSPSVLIARIRDNARNQREAKQNINAQADALEAKLSVLQAKREKLVDAYANGIITIGELKNRTKAVDEELHAVKAQTHLLAAAETDTPNLPEEQKVAQFASQIRSVLEAADPRAKQRLMRYFVDGITLSKEEATVSASVPKSFSCVPTSTASIELGQKYTGYPFQFTVKVPRFRRRRIERVPLVVAA